LARDTQSEKDHVTYRTYDNRAVTRDMIEGAFRTLEARRRSQERWANVRTWVIAGLVTVILMVAFVILVWWRISTF